jgi:hypothetical protein
MFKKVRHPRLYVRAELHAGNRKAQKERAMQERWVVWASSQPYASPAASSVLGAAFSTNSRSASIEARL